MTAPHGQLIEINFTGNHTPKPNLTYAVFNSSQGREIVFK